jgi:hypothetical protein
MFTKVFLCSLFISSHILEKCWQAEFFLLGAKVLIFVRKEKSLQLIQWIYWEQKAQSHQILRLFFHVWRGTQPVISSLAPDWVPKNMAVIVVTQKHRQVPSNRSWRGADDQLPQSLDFDRLKRSFSWHEMVTKLSWIQRVQLLHQFMVEVFFP